MIASSRSIYGEGAYRTDDGRIVYPSHRADADMAAGDFDVRLPGEGALTLIATDESAKLHPSSVYGITKQMQESLIMTVAPTLGIEAVSLRYQNVYGPGQSLKNPYTGILSIFSTLIRQGRDINIFEDGLESRDFVYIDDVVESTYLASTLPAAAGRTINVGSGVATTVNEVVAALFDAFGVEVPTTITGNYRLGDIRHNVADTTALRDVLGYEPADRLPHGRRALRRVGAHRAHRGERLRALPEGDGGAEPAQVMVTAPTGIRAFPHSRNSLNLFRLMLAAAVLFAHAFYITGNGTGPMLHGENLGGWAVAGFFVLCGIPHHGQPDAPLCRENSSSIGSLASTPRSSSSSRSLRWCSRRWRASSSAAIWPASSPRP